MPAVLESLGSDPAEVFSRAHVDLALFDDPDQLISLAAVGRPIQQCIASTGCEHFGLRVGERGGQSALGLLGRWRAGSTSLACRVASTAGSRRERSSRWWVRTPGRWTRC